MDGSFSLAVHALVLLSHTGECLSSETLGRKICTNPARVRRVLSGLRRFGFVETREGSEGGYRLCADPAVLTLDQVARAVEARFVSCSWHSGEVDRDCLASSGMAGVMDELFACLNERCAEFLEGVTVAEIEEKLYGRTGGIP